MTGIGDRVKDALLPNARRGKGRRRASIRNLPACTLAFDLGRTLGGRLADETHLVIAQRQVAHLIGALPRFARSVDAWASMPATA